MSRKRREQPTSASIFEDTYGNYLFRCRHLGLEPKSFMGWVRLQSSPASKYERRAQVQREIARIVSIFGRHAFAMAELFEAR